jgi:hypothetical protein
MEFENQMRQEFPRRAKEGDLLFAFRRLRDHLEVGFTYRTELFAAAQLQARAVALQAVLERLVDRLRVREILRKGSPARAGAFI